MSVAVVFVFLFFSVAKLSVPPSERSGLLSCLMMAIYRMVNGNILCRLLLFPHVSKILFHSSPLGSLPHILNYHLWSVGLLDALGSKGVELSKYTCPNSTTMGWLTSDANVMASSYSSHVSCHVSVCPMPLCSSEAVCSHGQSNQWLMCDVILFDLYRINNGITLYMLTESSLSPNNRLYFDVFFCGL
mgnify:CR=1 FL=1